MNFTAHTAWTGSTGEGWEHYDRSHTACAEPAKQRLTVTTAESKGDPDHLNPEQLLLMAASSCQMLWFLHLAAKARIDVVSYEDACAAEMPEDRITRVVLRPEISVHGERLPADWPVAGEPRDAHDEPLPLHRGVGGVLHAALGLLAADHRPHPRRERRRCMRKRTVWHARLRPKRLLASGPPADYVPWK